MPTFIHQADGTKTVFGCSSSALAKTVRVNGVVVTPASTNNTGATLTAAPVRGAIVEIFYGPFNGADPLTCPFTLEGTNKPVITPVVRYWGAGADALAFALDPAARTMDVTASGVSTSY